MAKRIFVSYSHRDQQWVRESLVSCLQGAGVDVVVDYLHMQVAQSGVDLILDIDMTVRRRGQACAADGG